jgi:hypothetical protein
MAPDSPPLVPDSEKSQSVLDDLLTHAVYNFLFAGCRDDDGLARRIGALVEQGAVFRRYPLPPAIVAMIREHAA